MKIDMRKSDWNRERARRSATQQWTLDRRKAHSLRYVSDPYYSEIIQGLSAEEFQRFVLYRRHKFPINEALRNARQQQSVR